MDADPNECLSWVKNHRAATRDRRGISANMRRARPSLFSSTGRRGLVERQVAPWGRWSSMQLLNGRGDARAFVGRNEVIERGQL
jgi:hypothetical protein